MQRLILLLIVSFLLGSIPFGFIISWLVKGIDIRNFGSGNIGATNVFRVLGKKWGILVFFLDFFKGFIPPFIVKFLINNSPNYFYLLSAIFVVAGHNWTPFLKFRGGKGVATSLGAMSSLAVIFPSLWFALLISILIWVIFFLIFRYVSLASILAGFCFFISSIILNLPNEFKFFSFILFIFILIRHNKNIKNLILKKEYRFKT